MSEETLIAEDQSHYEVSLTAGQAFLAFVLLLLSLAASFAFGLMIGKGQADERLVVRKDPPAINEAAVAVKKPAERIVEDFKEQEPAAPPATIVEEPAPVVTASAAPAPPQPAQVPHIAQLFSSADQKAAEGMAARLIDAGFSNAYVERGTNDKGAVFRVRVKFSSEAEARGAEARLREFSKEVWITKQFR
jgi:hypothetical protein